MATDKLRFLVLGATGGTGKHFTNLALADGHKVRALVRSPTKIAIKHDNLEVIEGSIPNYTDTDTLVTGIDCVICMLGDKVVQQTTKINTEFIKRLVPSMRQQGVKKLLYQAGGLSRPYQGSLSPLLWVMRNTLARGFEGQHQDNEAVIEYLATDANDIDWIVHRAGIYGDGPSKGRLERSDTQYSVANHRDCAEYTYRVINDPAAVHTCEFSHYVGQ